MGMLYPFITSFMAFGKNASSTKEVKVQYPNSDFSLCSSKWSYVFRCVALFELHTFYLGGDMGNIFYGSGWSKTIVGFCENGVIYKGSGWDRTQIGTYDDKYIYRGTSGWSQTIIGRYENGIIYSGSGWDTTQIGSYDQGIIRSGSSSWNCTVIGEYDGSPAGAAALLLFSELQNTPPPTGQGSDNTANPPSRTNRECPANTPDPFSGCITFLPEALGILIAIILLVYLVYVMYFVVEWRWASYAMFIDSIVSFVISNIILYCCYKKAPGNPDFQKDLVSSGLGILVAIGLTVSFIIYIIEQLILESLTFGMFLLGFIIAPVNFFIYAIPFLIVDAVILFIVKIILKKGLP